MNMLQVYMVVIIFFPFNPFQWIYKVQYNKKKKLYSYYSVFVNIFCEIDTNNI